MQEVLLFKATRPEWTLHQRAFRPSQEIADVASISHPWSEKGETMLQYALVFFIIAIIAGLLGFGVIASAAAGIAKILFFVFLVLFIVTLIGHASRGRAV